MCEHKNSSSVSAVSDADNCPRSGYKFDIADATLVKQDASDDGTRHTMPVPASDVGTIDSWEKCADWCFRHFNNDGNADNVGGCLAWQYEISTTDCWRVTAFATSADAAAAVKAAAGSANHNIGEYGCLMRESK